jgi:hypothetical protein
MRRWALVGLLVVAGAAYGQSDADTRRYERFMKDREELLTLFRSTPRLAEIDRPDVIQFIDRSRGQVFLVTKEGHPAHPAIVTRQMVEVSGQLAVKMDGDGGGSKEALKRWIDYMAAEDKRTIDAKRNEASK